MVQSSSSPNPKGSFTLGNRRFAAVTWWRDPALRTLYLMLVVPLVTSMTNGYDGSMMNALQTSERWQDYFGHPKGSLLAFYNLSFALGQLIAIIPFPFPAFVADRLGRRWGIVIGSSISLIGVALQAASINFAMFVVARFVVGFGVMVDHGSAPLLVTELAHTQHRAKITAVYNSTWYFGSIVAAWVTFGTININSEWAWRIPSLLQAFPALIQIIFIWVLPESPRFLIANDRHSEALDILKRFHGNGVITEFVAAEYIEIKETLALEREYSRRIKWADLLSTPGNRKRTLICFIQGFFSQWCGNGLVSYYLVPVLETVGINGSSEQAGLNGGLQIWNFIVAMWAAFNVDRFGRRPMVIGSTAAMLVIFIIWTVLSAQYNMTGNAGDAKGVIATIFLFYTAFNCGWQGLVLAYPIEILPYEIRAKGLNVVFFGVSTSLLNQYVNPVGIENEGWKFYIFYCVWLAVELVVVYFLWVETKNTPLEEIAKYFDGESAKIGGDGATAQANVALDELRAKGKLDKLKGDDAVMAVKFGGGDGEVQTNKTRKTIAILAPAKLGAEFTKPSKSEPEISGGSSGCLSARLVYSLPYKASAGSVRELYGYQSILEDRNRAQGPSDLSWFRHLMATRRPHKKSRNGCVQCKQRRLKCDEKRPTCGNCESYVWTCHYVSNSTTSRPASERRQSVLGVASPSETSPANSNASLAKPSEQSFKLVDLELLHHFTTQTYRTLSSQPELQTIWQVDIPQLALQHNFLLHGIFAVSALHLGYLRTGKAQHYGTLASEHQNIALSSFTPLTSMMDGTNFSALFASSILLIVFSLASQGPQTSMFDTASFGEGQDPVWIEMVRGVRTILSSTQLVSNASILDPFIHSVLNSEVSIPLSSSSVPELFELSKLDVLCTNPPEGAEAETAYKTAIVHLRSCFARRLDSGYNHCLVNTTFMWPTVVSQTYVNLLTQRKSEAMIILAWYGVLLKQLDNYWWIKGWSTHLVERIYNSLDENYKPWMTWPMQAVGGTLS